MKKVLLLLTVASLFVFAGCEKDDFETNALFSVSEGHQVRFAPGNLEYDSISGYRFATRQYDFGGYFGWGTGSNPMLNSMDDEDYSVFFDDWGNYINGRCNHINARWRTLTYSEWNYVIDDRTDAATKRGLATVCGVPGMILLPDNWEGGTINTDFDHHWDNNVYDASAWSDMEKAGAVFLPAARNSRFDPSTNDADMIGIYWSATPFLTTYAYCVFFSDYYVFTSGNGRSVGQSVRLVQDI